MSEPEPVVDWEAKFHAQVSDNIRHKATVSAKLAGALLDLDQANGRIQDLQAQVRRLTPAGDRLEAANRAAEAQAKGWGAQLQAKNVEIAALKAERARGQRAVLESVISWLGQNAAKMPAPLPGDEIELA